MDTLKGIQRLFDQAKREPVQAHDVAESIQNCIRELEPGPLTPSLDVWKISAGALGLAAVIPMVFTVNAFLLLDDLAIDVFPLIEGPWLW